MQAQGTDELRKKNEKAKKDELTQSAEEADPQLAAATHILRSSVLTQQCDDSSTCRLVNMSVTPTRRYSNGQGSRPGFHRQVTTDHVSSHL